MKAQNYTSDFVTNISAKTESHAPKRIFIVDDHPVFREGMRLLLLMEPDLRVCGEAEDCTKALQEIPRVRPDLVLIDITLTGESGLQLVKKIRGFDQHIKLLVVSMHDEAIYANRVLRAGGNGYIMKQQDPDEIIHAIRDILAGHLYVSDELLNRANDETATPSRDPKQEVRPIDQLTDLELEILQFLGRRKGYSEIARLLHCEVGAVTAACDQIKRKLRLRNTFALLRYATVWMEPWLKSSTALTPAHDPRAITSGRKRLRIG